MSQAAPALWVISDGRRGIENQALGLAEALARQTPITIKRKIIGSDPSFAALPPSVQYKRRSKPVKYGLAAPFPDIAIGCGRQAMTPLRAIKAANPNTFIVYIQDPRGSYSQFDLIIAPAHDEVSKPNVVSMIGSPNRITDEKLQRAQSEFADTLARYSAPRAALLIGGTSKRQLIDTAARNTHLTTAKKLLTHDFSLLITLSRRTDEQTRAAWVEFVAAHKDHVWLYDERADDAGANPYFAFLAASDIIFVTQDSTNMLTEAYYTGAPVYRLSTSGKTGKFETLYNALDKLRPQPPLLETLTNAPQSYSPLNETDRMAKILWNKYTNR